MTSYTPGSGLPSAIPPGEPRDVAIVAGQPPIPRRSGDEYSGYFVSGADREATPPYRRRRPSATR
ncbi:MAG: hypothetical protein V9G13_08015 [Marmoricola sp.]